MHSIARIKQNMRVISVLPQSERSLLHYAAATNNVELVTKYMYLELSVNERDQVC